MTCGCRIRDFYDSNPAYPRSKYIEYCPLHAAAERMREALKQVVSDGAWYDLSGITRQIVNVALDSALPPTGGRKTS